MKTPVVLVVAGCVAVALAGCGTQHAGQADTGQTGSSTPMARSVAATPTPAQRAAADAASLLAAFPAPPGAVRTGRSPVSWLNRAPETPLTPDLATRTGWWRIAVAGARSTAAQAQAILSWVRAHMPAGFTLAGSGWLGQGPHFVAEPGKPVPHPALSAQNARVWFDEFDRPPVRAVLSQRSLLVAVASDGNRQVAIRVDAEVVWLPAKPAAERIPAAARVVTIAPVPGLRAPAGGYEQPVTITDPGKVARIAAVIDGLPVFPPGEMSCPMFQGGGMRLTFRASMTRPVLAVVTGDTTGCGTVAVTIGGEPMRSLGGSSGMQRQVMAIAGLHWPGYPVG